MLDLVNHAIGVGGRVNDSAVIHHQGLHLEFLRFENHSGFAVGRESIHARRGSRSGVKIAVAVGCNRPDISRWSSRQRRERRSQFQPTGAAYGNALGRALDQFLEFRLFPGARAFGKDEARQKVDWNDCKQPA